MAYLRDTRESMTCWSQDIFTWHQEFSVGIVLQRGLVNDAIKHTIPTWMGRYATVCATPDTGYHVLMDKLLKSIVQAIGLASEGLDLSPEPDPFGKVERLERCSLVLRFKEHIGRERAMLAAKGESRWAQEVEDRAKRLFGETTDGTKELLQSILEDKLLGHATESRVLVDALTEMHGLYEKEVKSDFTIPAEKAVHWFEILTRWIDFAYDHMQTEIEALGEDLPADNVALPRVDVDLRVRLQDDVGDEDLRLLLSDLRAGKLQKIVVMAGAGISVSANLPDFRSKGGLYDQLRQSTNISSPESIFSQDFLHSDPQVFFEVMQKLRADTTSPTLTHHFIEQLQEKNLLQRCYTQNIDCLERRVGIEAQSNSRNHVFSACFSVGSLNMTKETSFLLSEIIAGGRLLSVGTFSLHRAKMTLAKAPSLVGPRTFLQDHSANAGGENTFHWRNLPKP